MKIIKVIFFSLLGISLIVCTGVFIFLETFDADPYLSRITQQASLSLGRSVSIGNLGLGVSSKGITLDAGPLVIADDKSFTTQPFIKIDRVRIGLDFMQLILRREIHITGILLQSPQIHFIRSQDGDINVRSFGQHPVLTASTSPTPGVGVVKQSFNSNDTKIRKPPYFDFKSVRIQDASISFINQNQTMPMDIWLTDINANIDHISFTRPFQLSFRASLHTDLSQLDIKQFNGFFPKHTAGVVQLNIADLEAGASGNFNANGDITITGGVIKDFNIIKTILSRTVGVFSGMNVNIDKLMSSDTIIEKAQAKFSIHDRSLFIDDSSVETNIFDLTAKGSIDQGLNTDMQTLLRLNGDVSEGLVSQFDGVKYFMDDSKRIAIGGNLTGVIPRLKYKPNKDFKRKSKKALKNLLMNFL